MIHSVRQAAPTKYLNEPHVHVIPSEINLIFTRHVGKLQTRRVRDDHHSHSTFLRSPSILAHSRTGSLRVHHVSHPHLDARRPSSLHQQQHLRLAQHEQYESRGGYQEEAEQTGRGEFRGSYSSCTACEVKRGSCGSRWLGLVMGISPRTGCGSVQTIGRNGVPSQRDRVAGGTKKEPRGNNKCCLIYLS